MLITVESVPNSRLDVWLTMKLGNYSRARIQQMIRKGHILLNNEQAKSGTPLHQGDIIQLNTDRAESETSIMPESLELNIIFQDEYLAIVDKPQGMLTHPAGKNRSGTLVNALLFHIPELSNHGGERPGIVHRLDKDTSGLLIVAKTVEAHHNLSEQFKDRSIKKTYLAIVEGVIKINSGEVNLPLSYSNASMKGGISTAGRKSNTKFEVIERLKGHTLVKCQPVTGRTHQIRIHLSAIGYPVCGDMVYGNYKCAASCTGHLLHASSLEFLHPETGNKMIFDSPLPLHFKKVYNRLKETDDEN